MEKLESKKVLFGAHLLEVVTRPDNRGNPIPVFIEKICSKILAQEPERLASIFRDNAPPTVVQKVINELNSKGMEGNIEAETPETLAGVLKTFLGSLRDPLIPHSFYCWFSVVNGYTVDSRWENLAPFVSQLPPQNEALLAYLCAFLQKVLQLSFDGTRKQTESEGQLDKSSGGDKVKAKQEEETYQFFCRVMASIFTPLLARPKGLGTWISDVSLASADNVMLLIQEHENILRLARRCHDLEPMAIPVGNMTRIIDDSGTGAQPYNVSLWRPEVPNGYVFFGDFALREEFGKVCPDSFVLAIKDSHEQGSGSEAATAAPVDFRLVWTYSKKGKELYIWNLVAPQNYVALGSVVTVENKKPNLLGLRCLHSKYVYHTRALVRGSPANQFDPEHGYLWSNKKTYTSTSCSFWRIAPPATKDTSLSSSPSPSTAEGRNATDMSLIVDPGTFIAVDSYDPPDALAFCVDLSLFNYNWISDFHKQ